MMNTFQKFGSMNMLFNISRAGICSTQFEGCMGVAGSKDLTTPVSFTSVSHTSGVKKTFLVLEAWMQQ